MEPSIRQRSRKGCLTCRQKRKKCDEIKPVCGRCTGNDDCIWPAAQSTTRTVSSLPRIRPRTLLGPKPAGRCMGIAPTSASDNPAPKDCPNIFSTETSSLFPEARIEHSPYDFTPYSFVGLPNTSDLLPGLFTSVPLFNPSTFGAQEHLLGSRHGLLPRSLDVSALYQDEGETDYALDEDEEEVFKTAEWLPATLQLVGLYLSLDLPNQEQIQWPSIIESYFTFFIRYSYDSSNLHIHTDDTVARHSQIESVRLAVLGTSLLFHTFLKPGFLQTPLRKYANELMDAAATALQFEECQPNTPLSAQLAGISEILGFYYYAGDLGGYVRYIEKGLPLVQKLVGTAPVSIHKLYGPETLDIRLFAWCDVFSAMATSRPTRLVYDSNADILLKRNQEGPSSPFLDLGLEWLAGLPDAFLLLTIQIINLKHALISPAERISQAAAIEVALRGWKVWPSDITNSMMRIQRVSAQEIWRHSTILYLYQSVYKATPSDRAVQQSVKQIIKLASTLRPGHNPDCLLYIPYFLAGTFAISAKDRQFIRGRLMRCGISSYMETLGNALDELWGQLPIDKHVDWTSRNPPLVMF